MEYDLKTPSITAHDFSIGVTAVTAATTWPESLIFQNRTVAVVVGGHSFQDFYQQTQQAKRNYPSTPIIFYGFNFGKSTLESVFDQQHALDQREISPSNTGHIKLFAFLTPQKTLKEYQSLEEMLNFLEKIDNYDESILGDEDLIYSLKLGAGAVAFTLLGLLIEGYIES